MCSKESGHRSSTMALVYFSLDAWEEPLNKQEDE